MDDAFIFDKYVTGKAFTGRYSECNALGNLIERGENVSIYAAPKAGKTSLVQQALINLRTSGSTLTPIMLSILKVRTAEDYLSALASAVISAVAAGPYEYESFIQKYLPGGNFYFDSSDYEDFGKIVQMRGAASEDDVVAGLSLPYAVAEQTGKKLCIVIDEFQTIMQIPSYERGLRHMEVISSEYAESGRMSYVFCGSAVNAMKYIFAEKKFFFRNVVNIPLSQISEQDVIDYIVEGFRPSGKVIEKDLIQKPYRVFRGSMWYLNQMFFLCGARAIGYINEKIISDSIETLISYNLPRFRSYVNSLTVFQISFLRAVLHGQTRFSAAEVIEKYDLHSSANVKRVCEALMKKEILTFTEKGEPVVIDPLFEYWFRREIL